MARQANPVAAFDEVDGATLWPTMVRTRRGDGRIVGTDNSVWLYRKVPTAAVADAKSPLEQAQASGPLRAFLDELAADTRINMGGRRTSRSGYRNVHILAVNIPQLWLPKVADPNRVYLEQSFPDEISTYRCVLVGVELRPALLSGSGSWRDQTSGAWSSLVETFTSGAGTPLADYDSDLKTISDIATRSGLRKASNDDLRMADAWFTLGGPPDTPMVHHADHTHVFASPSALQAVSRADITDCMTWPDVDESAVTIASIPGFDLGGATLADPGALWGAALWLRGALAISVRGAIEPAKVTAGELAKRRKKNLSDINDRLEAGKLSRADHDMKIEGLEEIEAVYRTGGGSPTLTEASVLVAFDGHVDDLDALSRPLVTKLRPMAYRGKAAMFEMMLASRVRANPLVHDLPVDVVAGAGLHSLAAVGDREGALLGFTELDRQPALVSHKAAAFGDALPLMCAYGATGSGKSLVMLWLADQWARVNIPVVIIDPKPDSDHSAAVILSGGEVASLDDLATADGVFDPLRISVSAAEGKDIAASMLMSINPWGSRAHDFETPLTVALDHGISRGAKTVGQALTIARADGVAPAEMVDAVLALRQANPMLAACVGMNPDTPGMRVSDKITYIKVGTARLDLPEPGATSPTLTQRISLAMVRMMVYGSAAAVRGRDGVVMLDEAWVFLGAGRAEIERLGRLARQQRFLPVLLTQRPSDVLSAGLAGYISRTLILPIKDEDEAQAALEACKLAVTPQRLSRITAAATKGGDGASDDEGAAPRWESMRALRDPHTRRVLRGTIAYYFDLSERVVPVEVTLPDRFIEDASTSPEDVDRRLRERAMTTP